jgi:competence protein ComEC
MKLPMLWIAAAFAAGIAFAIRDGLFPKFFVIAALAALLIALILLQRRIIFVAWFVTLIAWFALGGLALAVEHNAVPATYVTRLIAAGQLNTSAPLRWHGQLRDDPLTLPWGRRYDIDLDSVELAGALVPVSGGLRANLYGESHLDAAPQDLRAGDRVEALLRAQPPRNFLDPGAFDLRGYLAGQRIDLTGSLRSGELLSLTDRERPTVMQRLARARGNLLVRLDSLFAGQPKISAVLRAMLLGDRSFVDSDVVTAFQKTAAYHVLVVAGLHVGALVVFIFWFCCRLRFSIGATSFVTLIVLAGYVGVVQDRPPILRAALMAALYLCARPLFRRVDLLNTVALAALVILLWKPSSLADSSFQLSFLAAGVIAALALPWMERTSALYRAGLAHLGDVTRDAMHPPKVAQFRIELRAAADWIATRLPHWLSPRTESLLTLPVRAGLRLWEIVLLSIVIQWGMLPVLARDFHRVSLAGPVSNIPAVILTGLIVPFGFLALVSSFVWSRLAFALARITGFLTASLLATVDWFSSLPRVSYRIPGPSEWLMIGFFVALIVLAAMARSHVAQFSNRTMRRQPVPGLSAAEWAAAVSLGALTILVASHPFAPKLARGDFEVSVLDVGQGDSIFTAFPDGRTMLIDGGGLGGSEWVGGYRSGTDVGEEVVSPYLWSRGLKRLDVVALTHAHHDHIDGLHAVLQNFEVGELWVGRDEETAAYKSLLSEASARGVAIVHKEQGSDFDWDGVTGHVLWPPKEAAAKEASNDDSLVMRFTDGSLHFMLPGDAEQSVENELAGEQASDQAPLAAEFLKVPHHGSKTSSTAKFLDAVAPKVAVASVGESNPYGHPAEIVVERYAQDGIRLLRTDRDGAVTALSDGKSLSVQSYAEEHPR